MTPAILRIGGAAYEVRAGTADYRLRRADRDGPWHTVRRTLKGLECDCPDARFRHHDCKHVIALKELTMNNTTNLPAVAAVELPAAVVTSPPAIPQPMAQLAQSLIKAQQACRAIAHDKSNTHHGYKYTSAEAVIEEGNRVLGLVGLALAPVAQSVDGHAAEGENRFELTRKFLLIDQSGASLPISVVWPICPGNGRPLDKATAIAATLSLAYTLRDLLLMPRVDPVDDVAGRDDRGYQPPVNGAGPKPAPRPLTSQADVEASLAERDRHLAMLHEYQRRPVTQELRTDARDYLERELKPTKDRLLPEHLEDVRAAWKSVSKRLFPKPTQPSKPR